MASLIPAKLKGADIARFAKRAAQLEKYRPIVSYWCEYWILQQVLAKHLHTADEECQAYALGLMDKLEATKAANSANDAIVDDVAAKAYIENFALETFQRADDSQNANKVTRQTADTFEAAGTFLDLLAVWGAVDPDLVKKAKFAKFHALRIAKAIKAGEDPNATNPVVEKPPPAAQIEDDEAEAELKALEAQQDADRDATPRTVEKAPDNDIAPAPDSTLEDNAKIPPPLPAAATEEILQTPTAPKDVLEVSPIEPPNRQSSIGGGYFPAVPDKSTEYVGPLPGGDELAPAKDEETLDAQQDLTNIAQQPPPASMQAAHSFYNASQQHPTVPTPSSPGLTNPDAARPHRPSPNQMPTESPVAPPVQPSTAEAYYAHAPLQPTVPAVASPPVTGPVQTAPLVSGPPPGGYRTDDESVMAAQKHAKWAISALNFEDVNTAVNELRAALQSLGAS